MKIELYLKCVMFGNNEHFKCINFSEGNNLANYEH